MAEMLELSPASVEAVARRTLEMLSESMSRGGVQIKTVTDSDPWLTREAAAAYLSLTLRTFDRKRKLHPEALKPCLSSPMRWSRNALDVFKITRGAVLHGRPGRRPNVEKQNAA